MDIFHFVARFPGSDVEGFCAAETVADAQTILERGHPGAMILFLEREPIVLDEQPGSCSDGVAAAR